MRRGDSMWPVISVRMKTGGKRMSHRAGSTITTLLAPTWTRMASATSRDGSVTVRDWAAVGLKALGKDAAPAVKDLTRSLSDTAPSVRIEAAGALGALDHLEKALPVLEAEIQSSNLDAALHAARSLELLGERARPALPTMKRAYEKASSRKGDPYMFLRFALEPALKNLEK